MKKNFFWVSGPSLGCFWIVLRFWPKIFMKNACFLPKIEIGWDLGCFGKFHKILKIWHFLIMKNFFESGFLMSHGGSFPLGVKLHKCKKVYPKCVVAQRLGLLKEIVEKMSEQVSEKGEIKHFAWWRLCFRHSEIRAVCCATTAVSVTSKGGKNPQLAMAWVSNLNQARIWIFIFNP